MYRMPVSFGPSYGPRSGIGGRTFRNLAVKNTSYSVSFLTNREQLEAVVPPGFEVGREPIVTVSVVLLRELEWLAGRGYNIVAVTFPVVYNGEEEQAIGDFMPVLWENLADPIITGREELGYSKIYAEIPEPRVQDDRVGCVAGWLGFKFLDLNIGNLIQLSPQELEEHKEQAGKQRNDGVIHYKYMPRTGSLKEPDASYATIRPSPGLGYLREMWRGEGTLEFHEATWEDLPTMVDVVNTLYNLEKVEYRGACVTKSVGGTDLSEVRILR
ncbi:MAG: acetoacetate decarboxylase family protein [Candidatus Hydrogenedentota bacterium]|nr:MAG: acetoacetate decarboxylase family protein [Candidatus Hydrogenedentota bacterium]